MDFRYALSLLQGQEGRRVHPNLGLLLLGKHHYSCSTQSVLTNSLMPLVVASPLTTPKLSVLLED